METKVVTCGRCRQLYRFERPRGSMDEAIVVVAQCSCGNTVTHVWRRPSRWLYLEVD